MTIAIIGISLMGFGFIASIAATFTYLFAQADLATKRPDLTDEICGWSWSWHKINQFARLYRTELPQSNKIRIMRVLLVLAYGSFIAGGLLLYK